MTDQQVVVTMPVIKTIKVQSTPGLELITGVKHRLDDLEQEAGDTVSNTDPRLSDAREPLPHNHPQSDVTGLTQILQTIVTLQQVNSAISTAVTALVDNAPAELNTLGELASALTAQSASITGIVSSLQTKVNSNDSRLTDARTPLPHNHTQTDITGLSSALSLKVDTTDGRLSDARTPLAHIHSQNDVSGLSGVLSSKADLVGGMVPTSQIPSLALTSGRTVASRSALMALTDVQPGDIGIITATTDKGTYILRDGGSASVWGDWLLMSAPTDVVSSVNGQQGVIVLSASDVGAATAAQGSLADTAVQKASGINRLYARNSSGTETTVGYSETATAGVVAFRGPTGTFDIGAPSTSAHPVPLGSMPIRVQTVSPEVSVPTLWVRIDESNIPTDLILVTP